MSIYDITIAGTGGTGTSTGFIDPQTVNRYMEADAANVPTNYASSLSKSRANRRYRSLIQTIQFYSGLQIIGTSTTGTATANAAPATVVLRCEIADIDHVTTISEDDGSVLVGIPAVKRIVARALNKVETVVLDVFDPTKSTAPGNTTSVVRTGTRFNIETVGALYTTLAAAEASVSVATV